ncbi:hypothetical protein J517_4405, partial [Acinetobacter baumannii 118362]
AVQLTTNNVSDSQVLEDLLAQIDTAINTNYSNKFAAAVGYITADPIAPSVVKK